MAKFYADGLLFTCTSCGNCCRTPGGKVPVNNSEIQDLASFVKLDISEFHRKFCTHNGSKIHLKEQENAACIFLLENRCMVYDARPLQCRTFPFWPENLKSPYRWKQVKSDCPGIDEGDWHPLSLIQELMNLQKLSDKSTC